MLQPLTPISIGGFPVDWGLGVARIDIEGVTIWAHPGDVPGYHAFIGFDPDTGAIVSGTINTQEGDVLFPAIGALQYINSLQTGS